MVKKAKEAVAEDNQMIVIDGSGKVLGRVGTFAVKQALLGKKVILLNAERLVISGERFAIFAKLQWRRSLTNKADPSHAAKYPRVPRMLVKRMLRGMLPHKLKHGRDAFKRLMIYEGIPEEFKGSKITEVPGKRIVASMKKRVTVMELCRNFSYSG